MSYVAIAAAEPSEFGQGQTPLRESISILCMPVARHSPAIRHPRLIGGVVSDDGLESGTNRTYFDSDIEHHSRADEWREVHVTAA